MRRGAGRRRPARASRPGTAGRAGRAASGSARRTASHALPADRVRRRCTRSHRWRAGAAAGSRAAGVTAEQVGVLIKDGSYRYAYQHAIIRLLLEITHASARYLSQSGQERSYQDGWTITYDP